MARKKKEEEDIILEKPKVFKVKLSLKSGIEGIDNYINETKEHWLEFDITALNRVVTGLSEFSMSIVNRLFHISSLPDPTIPTLEDEKTEEVFSKLMTVVNNAKKIYELCEEARLVIAEVEEQVEEKEVEVQKEILSEVSKGGFEAIQKKLREARNLK